MDARNVTEKDRQALRDLSEGGSVTQGRFHRLCDLGLAACESRTTISGTSLVREERAWLTQAGQAEVAAARSLTGDAAPP